MRIIKGLIALVALIAVLVGMPAALVALGGNPLPDAWPGSLAELWFWLTTRAGTDLYLSVATLIGWLAWASFALSILVEIPAQVTDATTPRTSPAPAKASRPRLPGLGLQQRAARGLVAAALALFTSVPLATVASAATAGEPAPTTVSAHTETTANINDDTDAAGDAGNAGTARQGHETPEDAEQTYTVRQGDSLWSIAQAHLGDGARWPEIAELNYGRAQADGSSLQHDRWLNPGWQLILPTNTTPTRNAETTHEVQAGETLWAVAEDELGDGARWPEIAEASADVDQPGGDRLTDPDTIRPGWTLHVPTGATNSAQSAPDRPAVPSAPETASGQPQSDTQAPETSPETPDEQAETSGGDNGDENARGQTGGSDEEAAITEPEAPAAADGPGEEPEEDGDLLVTNVRTIGGTGALLAAGVLGLLALKRSRTQSARTPGTRLAMPPKEESVVEQRLREVADPIGLEAVDHALRDLATWHQKEALPLPDVRAARLTDEQFQLYLAAPAALPAPWRGSSDQCIWTIDAARVDQRTTDTPLGTAPYPSLVTLGHDEEDAHLLLDLEHLEHLDIRGDVETSHATLAALAVELATTPWADDLQVTLVGTLPGLADAVDTGRIRHVSGLEQVMRELDKRAERVGNILDEAGVESLSEARGRGLVEDTWTPEILLIGSKLDPELRDRLDELVSRVPRVGIATVTSEAQSGQWVLDLDQPTEGVLSPVGMRIRPQMISTSEYAQILSVLTSAEQTVPGPTWAAALAEIEEPHLDEVPVHVAVDDIDVHITTTHVEQPDDHGDDAHDQHDQDDVHEHREEDDGDEVEDVVVDAGEGEIQALRRPRLRLLGPVELEGATGTPPESKHEVQSLELLAFLALNPGATHQQLSAAIWPGKEPTKSTRNSAVSRARRWLGTDPATGDPYLPEVGPDGLYQAHYDTDWHQFLELIGNEDITTVPTTRLAKALDLVRSHPFDRDRIGRVRVRANRYGWAESDRQEMASTIVDVARETARRALLAGDIDTAEKAATTGLTACAEQFHEESLWRYLIRCAWAHGDTQTLDQRINDLNTILTEQDADLEPETGQLLDEITTARRYGPATGRPAAI